MNIGFTGTREGMTDAQLHWVKRIFMQYFEMFNNSFHHGDCVGADTDAYHLIWHLRKGFAVPITIVSHPPIDGKHRSFLKSDATWAPAPYLDRNHHIVDCSDRLIACPRGMDEELSSGTWSTIRYARKKRIPVTIIWPDGKVTEERS